MLLVNEPDTVYKIGSMHATAKTVQRASAIILKIISSLKFALSIILLKMEEIANGF